MATQPMSKVRFFTDYEDQSKDQSEESDETAELVIPEDLTELSVEEITDLHDRAVDAFTTLYGDGSGFSPEDVETLTGLRDGIKALRARKGKLDAEAEALTKDVNDLAADLDLEIKAEDDPEDDPEDAEAEEAAGDEEQPEAVEVEQPEAVAASARGEIRINIPKSSSKQVEKLSTSRGMKDIVLSPKGKGMERIDLAKAVDKHLSSFNLNAYKAAARSNKKINERFQIATFNREFPEELIVTGKNADEAIQAAVDQSRLRGGSLTAAGGWCGPSENVYTMCNLSEAADLIDVPEIQINRGGINHTLGPDYASVYADTGFCYTEAEDIEGDYDGQGGGSKPCFHLECPDFTEDRLEYCGVCITAGLMQVRGYPEALANLIDLALTSHAHRVSAAVINKMVDLSTAVSWPANQKGAVAPLLTAIDLQASHYRAVNRMSSNAALEVVLPTWTKSIVRADLARRQGVDLLDVPEARINAWFAARNVSAQYVVDWQDIASTPASGYTAPESEVDFLLYSAGTFVKGVTESFTLENIYDSVGLGTNDFTALFTEDPFLVAKRCHDARVVTVPICPDGATHVGIDIGCNGA